MNRLHHIISGQAVRLKRTTTEHGMKIKQLLQQENNKFIYIKTRKACGKIFLSKLTRENGLCSMIIINKCYLIY